MSRVDDIAEIVYDIFAQPLLGKDVVLLGGEPWSPAPRAVHMV